MDAFDRYEARREWTAACELLMDAAHVATPQRHGEIAGLLRRLSNGVAHWSAELSTRLSDLAELVEQERAIALDGLDAAPVRERRATIRARTVAIFSHVHQWLAA